MITRQFICEECEEEFDVTWDDSHHVRFCPFCGELLDEDDEDDDDDWDDDDEDEMHWR